jgi:ATP-dependent exoDNAse (exonuclease V) beta subunit
MDRGTAAHKVFEDYILGKTEDLGEHEYYRNYLEHLRLAGAKPEFPIALDKNWKEVEWDAPDRWWRGVLDLVALAPTEVVIVDWKTGNEYSDHKDQREIYAAAYHAKDPTREHIRVIHTYVDKRQNTMSLYHATDIPAIRKEWEEKIEEMFNDETFIPNPGFYCRSCQYSRWNGGPCRF